MVEFLLASTSRRINDRGDRLSELVCMAMKKPLELYQGSFPATSRASSRPLHWPIRIHLLRIQAELRFQWRGRLPAHLLLEVATDAYGDRHGDGALD